MIPFPLLFSFASNSGNLGGSILQPPYPPTPKFPYQGDTIHGFSENCQIPEPNLPLFFSPVSLKFPNFSLDSLIFFIFFHILHEIHLNFLIFP